MTINSATRSRKFVAGGASLGLATLLVTAAGVEQAAAVAEQPEFGNDAATCDVQESKTTFCAVKADEICGQFAYTQDAVSDNQQISKVFRKVVSVLCSSGVVEAAEPGDWTLRVSGDVENGFSATLGELSEEESESKVFTCACSNNPAGGNAIATADVEGIPIRDLLLKSHAAPNVNTVVVRCADGVEQTFPLDFLMGNDALIAYAANGEALSQSVGGTNQLWMGSAAGKYFARDVVEVRFEARSTVPESPSFAPTESEYVNRPNVGIDE